MEIGAAGPSVGDSLAKIGRERAQTRSLNAGHKESLAAKRAKVASNKANLESVREQKAETRAADVRNHDKDVSRSIDNADRQIRAEADRNFERKLTDQAIHRDNLNDLPRGSLVDIYA